jgi:uncharacterized protein YutE (UPF0331/DUF86 family)
MKNDYKQRLVRHIRFLENELKEYSKFKHLSYNEYTQNNDKRRNVERWIENIVNSSIDISKIILILEDITLPDNYKEIVLSISIVEGLKDIDSKALSRWVKLRNIVVHEYLDIRWAAIQKFIQETEDLYKEFLDKVTKFLEKQLKETNEE